MRSKALYWVLLFAIGSFVVWSVQHDGRSVFKRIESGTESSPRRLDSAQGVHGRIVDERGRPIADARVYLVAALDHEDLVRSLDERINRPPTAQATTPPDGGFNLGVEAIAPHRQYALWGLHQGSSDLLVGNFIALPGDWYDAGDLTMQRGVTLRGTVTDTGGKQIAGVRVRALREKVQVVRPPGREYGIETFTDAAGGYELQLDPVASYEVSAAAQGHVREHRVDIHPRSLRGQRLDYRLERGYPLAVTVLDDVTGHPIPGARVTVSALKADRSFTDTMRTDARGTFSDVCLRRGRFVIHVCAHGYHDACEFTDMHGAASVTVRMSAVAGSVVVTVLDGSEMPQRDFCLVLKPAFEGKPDFGSPLLTRWVEGSKDGRVMISGVGHSTYVVEIHAAGYAKNFSERFTIDEGQRGPLRLKVALHSGGVIRGFVHDSSGHPVSGAKVSTMPNEMVENMMTRKSRVPYTITKASVQTSVQGEFCLDLLYPGKYQIAIKHTEYCTLHLSDIDVIRGETTMIRDVRVIHGCIVSGIARIDGTPGGQVRVIVSAAADEQSAHVANSEAVSNHAGHFELEPRLPPGRYELMAARIIGSSAEAIMQQLNASKQFLAIGPDESERFVAVKVLSGR